MTKNVLKGELATLIASGLKRRAITKCSQWTSRYRIMGNPFPGPCTPDRHPWTLEMLDCESEMVVGQKAAQMGYTEWAMNVAFFSMDIKKESVLYVLPTIDDASSFSAGRFDPALELSPYLQSFFDDVNNVKLKRAGQTLLYVRGSNSRSQLKSIPVPKIILDEADEMPDWAIPLVKERQAGQVRGNNLLLSTPSRPDFGINKEYNDSSQDVYFFKCPGCSRLINLEFENNLVICGESVRDPDVKKSYLKCHLCDKQLDFDDKINFLRHRDEGGTGRFVPGYSNRTVKGFHVSQLYSMALGGRPENLAVAALQTDEASKQEFYNSKLGLPYVAEGAKITEGMYERCKKGYQQDSSLIDPQKIRTMGIDVGAVLHIVIYEWTWLGHHPGNSINDQYKPKVLYTGVSSGSYNDFDEAYDLFLEFECRAGTVDAEPEKRAALKFCNRLYGSFYLCDYLNSQQGRTAVLNDDETTIKVNRTSWLDLTLGRYKQQEIEVPAVTHRDFAKQIQEPVRVFRQDRFGQQYAVYLNARADHFAHASNYAEIALPIAVRTGNSVDLTEYYQ